MAHSFVVRRKIFLNVPMYAHILRSLNDYKIEVLLGYTSSYFAWTPRIALICISSIVARK